MRIAPWILLLLVPASAEAHEFWLSPSSYATTAGVAVTISARVGTGFRGEAKPYAAPRLVRFTMSAARVVDLSPAAQTGDDVWARVVLADGGGALIAYQSNQAEIELPPPEFDAYLRLEGLDEPLAARTRQGASAGPGRERYARCAKTWIGGTSVERLTHPVGLPLEIVPLADPTRGREARFRVVDHGRPLANALVRAWRRPLADHASPQDGAARDSVSSVAESRTDADGTCTLVLAGGGEWMVNVVHMVPSDDRKLSDWQSLWASLTFARLDAPR
jgi:uncharacterized GH25 family protein